MHGTCASRRLMAQLLAALMRRQPAPAWFKMPEEAVVLCCGQLRGCIWCWGKACDTCGFHADGVIRRQSRQSSVNKCMQRSLLLGYGLVFVRPGHWFGRTLQGCDWGSAPAPAGLHSSEGKLDPDSC
jgi:hypothetical protein